MNVFTDIWQHRRLALELSRRELSDRYLGQVIGVLWIFIHPIYQISILIFLYSVVFKARLNFDTSSGDYTTYILSGLVPWLSISDVLNRSSTCIRAKSNLVKQVIFPIQVLPVVSTLVAMVPQLIGMGILFLYILIKLHAPTVMFFALPLLISIQFIFMLGVAFILSSLGVYLRDLKDLIALFCSLGVYLSPIVYFVDWIPERVRFLIYLNPITHVVLCYQDIFFYQSFLHYYSWILLVVLAFVLLFFGFAVFKRLKTQFGSAL